MHTFAISMLAGFPVADAAKRRTMQSAASIISIDER